MAKQAEGPIRVSGKLGDTVYTRAGKYGATVRKVVKPGTKKDEQALKAQYGRTRYLNALASDINAIITEHSVPLKSGQFYVEVQRRFRREPLDNRVLLLRTLRGLEVHPGYPFSGQGSTLVTATPEQKGLRIGLQVAVKPPKPKQPVDSYCYEVLIATWTSKEEPADCEQQFSEWVMLADGKPEFEFFFPRRRGAVHWLVAVRIRLGKDGVPYEHHQCDGMQIADAGSFDPREQQWLQTRMTQPASTEMKKIEQVKPEVVRVKAKRFG